MSKFSRPSSWLRQIFTPSSTGWREPGDLSNDVSLTHPYDGSGWVFPVPAMASLVVVSAVGAATTTLIYTVPLDRITRLLGISVGVNAGETFNAAGRMTTPGGGQAFTCTELVTIPVSGEGRQLPGHPPVMLPGMFLSLRIEDGGAASQSATTIYFVEAPLGTVFYV